MFQSLRQQGLFAFKVERLHEANLRPSHPRSYHWVARHIVQPQRPAKFIIIVRDPMALLVSDYFPKLKWITGMQRSWEHFSVDELCDIFTSRYFEEGRHNAHLDWFDNDVHPATGIDVYTQPSPAQGGSVRFQQGNFDVLLLQLELDAVQKAQVVQDFVGLQAFDLLNVNLAEQKPYAEAYRQFKKRLVVPSHRLDAVYGSRYAQHCYSASDRERFYQRWAAQQA